MDLIKYVGWYYFKDGILYLIIGINLLLLFNKFIKNVIKKVNKVNLFNLFNLFFNSCVFLSFKMFFEKEEIVEYNIKVKYLFYYLDNNILNYKYYNWFYDNDSYLEYYSEFKIKLEVFEIKNILLEYVKDLIYVLNYNDGV